MLEALQVDMFAAFIGIWIAVCVASIVILILLALWMHKDALSRGMDATVWVVLLVIATLFGSFIGLIIVVVIYLVVRESHPYGGYPYGYPAPYTTPYAAPTAPCPVCGQPLYWYAQAGRWYCYRCQQYR